MNWFKKVRLDASKDRPVLRDIRALYYDGIGVPVRVLRLIENDPSYLAKPSTYASVIRYFPNYRLLRCICEQCPINNTIQNILKNPKDEYSKRSKYNKEIRQLQKIEKLAKSRKRQKYIFQNSRFRYSSLKNRYFTIYDINRLTLVPIKKLVKIEKNTYMIDDFEEANILLTTFHDTMLAKKICQLCPVKHAEDDVLKNINKKEEI